jgi:hypothetical protein
LKLTDYKILTNIQKTQVFETDGSEDEEIPTNHRKVHQLVLKEMKHNSITQHKVTTHIFLYSKNGSIKSQNHHNKALAVVPK